MDFSLNEQQENLRATARAFCEKQLMPLVREMDEKGEIPESVVKGMAKMGFLAMTIPERYGGAGATFLDAAIVAEEIARADISMATAVFFLVESGWGHILSKYGTEEVKQEVLPRVAKGEAFIGIASTEPSGGSDLLGMSTSMRRENGKLKISGEKCYISGVKEALRHGGGHLTIAKTAPELGHGGFSLCYLPLKGTKGIEVSELKQMGRSGISTGIIKIDGVELPENHLVGKWNRGFYHAMEGFNCARSLVSAACVGAATRALELGAQYIKERQAFGRSIAKFEGIQFQLADDMAKLESTRLLAYKAAWAVDKWKEGEASSGEVSKLVAMAKLTAAPLAFDVLRDVMIWHGAYGYMKDAGLEVGLRGVMSYLIGAEGAQNIMRTIIAREVLGKEYIAHR